MYVICGSTCNFWKRKYNCLGEGILDGRNELVSLRRETINADRPFVSFTRGDPVYPRLR
jgi:hypothetical protein